MGCLFSAVSPAGRFPGKDATDAPPHSHSCFVDRAGRCDRLGVRAMKTKTEKDALYRMRRDLLLIMADHPDARIVTDVGASMISGWGDLVAVKYYEKPNVIELVFD